MALLRRKKDTGASRTDAGQAAATQGGRKKATASTAKYDRIVRPHVTEKAILLSERGVSTFVVVGRANKKEIAAFIEAQYGVVPRVVRIAKKAHKEKFIRGRWGTKAGLKKAYVYLKEGDKIDLA